MCGAKKPWSAPAFMKPLQHKRDHEYSLQGNDRGKRMRSTGTQPAACEQLALDNQPERGNLRPASLDNSAEANLYKQLENPTGTGDRQEKREEEHANGKTAFGFRASQQHSKPLFLPGDWYCE
eukprot:gnl/MRDRNA2_/MRDRNA2_111631_c0_seq1.p1 gnl/MRDRNA2_/MRDRNA2_111631_c0~~gnl/MRDRNA2_/MRDRNA2_111631_c0_seq1.p1  ORF type:complete len:123 (+),score=24.62 gnl/MRDRNA2_/MRDRNA2_111631_c0_seq1:746-1114(+)